MNLIKNTILIFLCILVIAGCGLNNNFEDLNPGQAANFTASVVQYETLEKLVEGSELIAEVEVLNNRKKIEYQRATFTTNSLLIKEVIIGDTNLEDKEITILELGDFTKGEINLVQVNQKYLLFLKKYIGPVTTDAYVPVGVYQGKFKIHLDGSLKYEGLKIKEKKTYQEELADLPYEIAKKQLKMIK